MTEPTLTDVVQTLQKAIFLGLKVAAPAKIVTFDATTQTADVKLELITVLQQDGQEVPQLPLVVRDIPVVFPRSSAGYLTFPVNPGDTGQLIVNDRSLDKWCTQGTTVDPGLNHAHNLIDGVFYPGLHPTSQPMVPPTDGTATVVEGTASIKLGRQAILGVARQGDVVQLSPAFLTWLTNLAAAVPFGPPPGNVIGTIQSASSKVRAE